MAGTVVIVANTHLIRQALSQSLQPLGFKVHEFAEAAAAIAKLNALAPDLFVLDVDGAGRAWRPLAAGLQASAVTIVLLAGRFGLEDAHEALAAGVAGVILKPFQKETTVRLVELLLKRRGLRPRRAAPRFVPPQDALLQYRGLGRWERASVHNLAEGGLAVALAGPDAQPGVNRNALIPSATLQIGSAEAVVSLQGVHRSPGIAGLSLVRFLEGKGTVTHLLAQLHARVFGPLGKKRKW